MTRLGIPNEMRDEYFYESSEHPELNRRFANPEDFGSMSAEHLYLDRDLRRYRLLESHEEVVLAKRIEAGLYAGHLLLDGTAPDNDELRDDLQIVVSEGEEAKRFFIECNLRLVVPLARRSAEKKPGLPLMDHIQNGNMGLIRAVEKFDYKRGYRFSTYATDWIDLFMDLEGEEQLRAIRLPQGKIALLAKLNKTEYELRRRLGRQPSSVELAEAAKMDVTKLDNLRRVATRPLSFDAPLNEGEERATTLGEALPDPKDGYERVELKVLRAALRSLVNTLDELSAEVIRLHYGLDGGPPCAYAKIAELCGVSKEGARRIEIRALGQLGALGSHLIDSEVQESIGQ